MAKPQWRSWWNNKRPHLHSSSSSPCMKLHLTLIDEHVSIDSVNRDRCFTMTSNDHHHWGRTRCRYNKSVTIRIDRQVDRQRKKFAFGSKMMWCVDCGAERRKGRKSFRWDTTGNRGEEMFPHCKERWGHSDFISKLPHCYSQFTVATIVLGHVM